MLFELREIARAVKINGKFPAVNYLNYGRRQLIILRRASFTPAYSLIMFTVDAKCTFMKHRID